MGDIIGDITLVIWPAEDPVTKLMSSPMVDAFFEARSELLQFRSQKAQNELLGSDPLASTDATKKKKKIKQPSASSHLTFSFSLDLMDFNRPIYFGQGAYWQYVVFLAFVYINSLKVSSER